MYEQEINYENINTEIKRIEALIGTGKVNNNDVSFLEKLSNSGNTDARLVLGYYYLLERKDEKAALSLIGSKNV